MFHWLIFSQSIPSNSGYRFLLVVSFFSLFRPRCRSIPIGRSFHPPFVVDGKTDIIGNAEFFGRKEGFKIYIAWGGCWRKYSKGSPVSWGRFSSQNTSKQNNALGGVLLARKKTNTSFKFIAFNIFPPDGSLKSPYSEWFLFMVHHPISVFLEFYYRYGL